MIYPSINTILEKQGGMEALEQRFLSAIQEGLPITLSPAEAYATFIIQTQAAAMWMVAEEAGIRGEFTSAVAEFVQTHWDKVLPDWRQRARPV